MELTSDIVLEIPLWQMAVLLIILMSCLGFKKYAAGLICAILFAMYWGYVYNFDKFAGDSTLFGSSALVFLLIGIINALILVALFLCAFCLHD